MLFKSKTRERKILSTSTEPTSPEWLWLCHTDGQPQLKEYLNGKWTSVVSGAVNIDDFKEKLRQLEIYVDRKISSIVVPSVDLSNYYTKPQVDDLLDDITLPEVHDGITPHIDTETGNWFIGDTSTGIKAEGKGIRNISYLGTNVSGAANVLTIETTDGVINNFNIYNGKDGAPGEPGEPGVVPGQSEYVEVEVLQLCSGPLSEAITKAKQSDGSTMFQWILVAEDSNHNPFTKIIWHIGNYRFIDALGAEISNE